MGEGVEKSLIGARPTPYLSDCEQSHMDSFSAYKLGYKYSL